MSDHQDSFDYLTGAMTGGPHPAAVGVKFSPTGQVLPTAGNTMICHINPASPAHAALVRAQTRLKAGPLAGAYAFLPPESFHMTIFEGVIETARARARWPGHLPLDASIDTVTEDFSSRLTEQGLAQTLRARPTGIFGGFSVRMDGADPLAELELRQTRDHLQAATNLVREDHETYRFHITLAYLLRWLSDEEARWIIALSQEVGATLIAEMPEVTLGPVEFCQFETMHHFERLHDVD